MNYSEEREAEVSVKSVIVGESGSGKTNLLRRYVDDSFITDSRHTIGFDLFVSKKLFNKLSTSTTNSFVNNDTLVEVKFWDTAGQERFRGLMASYFRGAQCVVLTYSITDRNSFKKIEDWLEIVKIHSGDDKILAYLVGNKTDLESDRVVTRAEGEELAKKLNLRFFETSAKSGDGVFEAFDTLALDVFEKHLEKVDDVSSLTPSRKERSVIETNFFVEKKKCKC